MYRIRRESGDEVAMGSIDEFAAAVAAGTVTAKAEIYHARAERWLPIASHPHFKMAQDRINATTAPRPQARAVTASGQRPAITGSAPATASPGTPAAAPRPQAPQLRVVRPEAPAAAAVAPKAAPRWTAPQRSAATVTAPKPVAPVVAAPEPTELRLVQADAIVSPPTEAAEMEFELLPVAPLEPTPIPEPVAPAPELLAPEVPVADAVEPVAVAAPIIEPETVVERTPPEVQLTSHEDKPAAEPSEVELIHPDRSMPVVSDERDLPQLEIPAPVSDFTPVDGQAAPAARSKAPLFIGIGVAAAAAAAIGFFALKPSSKAPAAVAAVPVSQVAPAPSEPVAAPVATPTPTPAATAPSTPTGSSAGLGGDAPRKKRQSDDQGAKTDGLEPPPEEVIPAAPTLGAVGDAAALPTVDAQSAGTIDHAKALEKTRREIDSSMRQ